MSLYLQNFREITNRGGVTCSDSGFVIVLSKCCKRQWLYDEEILHLYPDASDLSKVIFNAEGHSPDQCPSCGAPDWDFGDALIDRDEIEHGPWAWAL